MRRHKFFWPSLRAVVSGFLRLKFGYRTKIAKDLPEQYIVLANHNTDWDPLFVGASFKRQMYFVASEHISRWKHAYKFIRYFFEPIMRYKGSVASSTVMDVLKKTRAGENVCIFAEGYRSWDGVTNPILPSTGKLVKKAGCALVTYKITGGYFVSPNWSEDGLRRGPIEGAVVNIYAKEQIAEMSADEINEVIVRDLHEDAYARQLAAPKRYKGKKLAHRLENLAYLCPKCGKQDSLRSEKDKVRCEACGLEFSYDEFGVLHGLSHKTVQELANWQRKETLRHAQQGESYRVPSACLNIITKQHEEPFAKGEAVMDGTSLRCGDAEILLTDITEMAMHGRHALVFSANKTYYELLPAEGSNTLKFLWLYESYNKVKEAVTV